MPMFSQACPDGVCNGVDTASYLALPAMWAPFLALTSAPLWTVIPMAYALVLYAYPRSWGLILRTSSLLWPFTQVTSRYCLARTQ